MRSLRSAAIVTCSELPRPDHGLPPLRDAFERAGVRASIVPWDGEGIDWSTFDCAVIQSTWNYVARFDAFSAWLSDTARATRLINDLPTIRWNIHKRYLLELAAAGIPVVPTTLVPAGSPHDWSASFERWGELVLKPAVSAGSFATIRVAVGNADAAEAHRAAHPARDFLVQPLLRSVLERGERNIVVLGGSLSHAIRKGQRWSGQAEASGGAVEPSADERALAESIFDHLRRIGLGTPAYARVDVADADDGSPLLMELELIEPSLFLDRVPGAADRLVRAIIG